MQNKANKASRKSVKPLRVPHIVITPTVFEPGEYDPELVVSARCEEFPDLEVLADTCHNALAALFDCMEELGWPKKPLPERLTGMESLDEPLSLSAPDDGGVQGVHKKFRRIGKVVRLSRKNQWMWFTGEHGVTRLRQEALEALVGVDNGVKQ